MNAYSSAQREEIVSLYSAGKSVTDIVGETNISHVTVRKVLAANGFDLPDKKTRRNHDWYNQPENISRFVALYKSGMSIKAIAVKEKISTKTLRKILIDAGVHDTKIKIESTPKERVPDEEFIRIWQTSQSASDVEKRTGISRQGVNSRLHWMRKNGVPLKKMKRKSTPKDWPSLIELAKQFEDTK